MNEDRPLFEKDIKKFKIDKKINVRSLEEIIRKRVDLINAEHMTFILECLFRPDIEDEKKEICFVRTLVDFI